MEGASLRLDPDGAQRHDGVMDEMALSALRSLASQFAGRPGARLFDTPQLDGLTAPDGPLRTLIPADAFPVRAVLFDKSAERNWTVGWHQDRTIAVRRRVETEGFGPWSVKAGLTHVEPPFEIIERMTTLRLHLDDCDDSNAPLLVAPGSHRLGKISASQSRDVAKRIGPATCHARAGDVWVYATAILHASEPSRTTAPRRVLQIDFAAEPLPGGLEWLRTS